MPNDEMEQVSEASVDLARALMVGQLRDLVLDHMRHEKKSALPWYMWPEDQQSACIDRVTRSVQDAIDKAVGIMARDGKHAVAGSIEQITIKDGLKIVVRSTHTTENLLMVGNKGMCWLVFADGAAYSGAQERKPVPLQQDLGLDEGEAADTD